MCRILRAFLSLCPCFQTVGSRCTLFPKIRGSRRRLGICVSNNSTGGPVWAHFYRTFLVFISPWPLHSWKLAWISCHPTFLLTIEMSNELSNQWTVLRILMVTFLLNIYQCRRANIIQMWKWQHDYRSISEITFQEDSDEIFNLRTWSLIGGKSEL